MRTLIFCVLVLSGSVHAGIYQCEGVFQDIPCAEGKGQAVQIAEQYSPNVDNPTLAPRIDLELASQIRSARELRDPLIFKDSNNSKYAGV